MGPLSDPLAAPPIYVSPIYVYIPCYYSGLETARTLCPKRRSAVCLEPRLPTFGALSAFHKIPCMIDSIRKPSDSVCIGFSIGSFVPTVPFSCEPLPSGLAAHRLVVQCGERPQQVTQTNQCFGASCLRPSFLDECSYGCGYRQK